MKNYEAQKSYSCFLLQIKSFCVNKCSFIMSNIRELAEGSAEVISLCFWDSLKSCHAWKVILMR